MVKFVTDVRFNGLATYGVSKFKQRLRDSQVPFADISSEVGKWDRSYFVLWFREEFEEDLFARILDGRLQKVVKQCALDAGFMYENTDERK